jgi:hypothetical protein
LESCLPMKQEKEPQWTEGIDSKALFPSAQTNPWKEKKE